MSEPKRGAVDGGFGRGVPLGGRDERPPTGYKKKDLLGDDDVAAVEDSGEDLFALETDDAEPDDRRRDPLRRR